MESPIQNSNTVCTRIKRSLEFHLCISLMIIFRAFQTLCRIFEVQKLIPTFKTLIKALEDLVGYKVQRLHCCFKNCIAFTGRFTDLEHCPCGEACYTLERARLNPDTRQHARDRVRKVFLLNFALVLIVVFKLTYSNVNITCMYSHGKSSSISPSSSGYSFNMLIQCEHIS